jgi:hypothetical protein
LLGVNEDGREDGKHENYMSINTKSTTELIAPGIRYPEIPKFPPGSSFCPRRVCERSVVRHMAVGNQ